MRVAVPMVAGLAGTMRAVYESFTSLIAQVNGIFDSQPSGTATLVAGEATVKTPQVRLASHILVSYLDLAGTPGILSVPSDQRIANVSFTIVSDSATDTSTVTWKIVG